MSDRNRARPPDTPLNPPDAPIERKLRELAGERPAEQQAAYIEWGDADTLHELTPTEVDEMIETLSELRRILRPGGEAWIIVPIDLAAPTTQEGRGQPDAVRAARFGSAAHQRLYGLDAARHFAAAGFRVREVVARAVLAPAAIAEQGIQPEERLFRAQPAR